MGLPVPTVTIYERPGCHLCEEALAMVESLAGTAPEFRIERVNIEDDDELHRRMLERIPVVAVDGREVAELEPDLSAVAAAIAGAATIAPDEHDRRAG